MDPSKQPRAYLGQNVQRNPGVQGTMPFMSPAVRMQAGQHLIPPPQLPQVQAQAQSLYPRMSSPVLPHTTVAARPSNFSQGQVSTSLTPQRPFVQQQQFKVPAMTPPPPTVQQRPPAVATPLTAPPLGGGPAVTKTVKKRPVQNVPPSAPPPVKIAEVAPAPKRKKKQASKVELQSHISTAIPESSIYNQLVQVEKKIDSTLLRKKHDIQEALRNPEKIPRTLRILLRSSVVKNNTENSQEGPFWSLIVTGRILQLPKSEDIKGFNAEPPIDPTAPPFSSFVKRLTVELDPSQFTDNLLTWDGETAGKSGLDGFEIKRKGTKDFTATIHLDVNYLPQRFQVSEKLSSLLGLKIESRPRVITGLWQYIKQRKLQNAQDPTIIECDAALREIFGETKLKMSTISSKIHPHLSLPKPIKLEHSISLSGPPSSSFHDVEVDIPIPLTKELSEYLSTLEKHKDINSFNDAILEDLERLEEHRLRRSFFLGFSESPADFITKLMASQERDLRQAMGGKEPGKQRKSSFYRQPWVEDAVLRYLNRKPAGE